MAQLICKNVSLGYDGKEIVSGLNFTVNEGDYLCVVGENGSGKTTLMKTLLNLHSVISGEITTSGLSKSEIGYLPQQTVVQKDFPASVEEIVISGCQGRCGLRPFYNKAERQRADENMERMNILPLRQRCYRELSGGQQQRVLLARALCATEKMLLLDEPVSGLDPIATAEMYGLIADINKKDKVTIIMISHDVKSVIEYGTHVLYLGRDKFFGSIEEFLNSPIAKNSWLNAKEGK